MRDIKDYVKKGYPSAKQAQTALNRIRAYGVVRESSPIRVYKSEFTGKWHLTSIPRPGEELVGDHEVLPEEIGDRLSELEARTKRKKTGGKSELPLDKVSLIIRDYLTEGMSMQQVADKHGVSAPTVSKYIGIYIKDSSTIKDLQNEQER